MNNSNVATCIKVNSSINEVMAKKEYVNVNVGIIDTDNHTAAFRNAQVGTYKFYIYKAIGIPKKNIQGCVLGYTQSDEITLILVDYKKLTSSAWFDYEVQKICSISASMATMAFNKFFRDNVDDYIYENWDDQYLYNYIATLQGAVDRGAMFDARCFNIPKEEVTNLVYWRQLDASRNSIQMVGQANFSHKELQNKSCNDIQDMLMTQKDINWNDLPTYQKRGSCCVRNKIILFRDSIMKTVQLRDTSKSENEWIIDTKIPIFKNEGREYIDRLVYISEGQEDNKE